MKRVESNLFRANKEKLKEEGHGYCFICGTGEQIETHHMMCPYAKKDNVDFEKLKEACEAFDVYGYSKKMKDIPITSVDDIRNLINLCQGHHKRADHGIHNIPFADWLGQMIQRSGVDEN